MKQKIVATTLLVLYATFLATGLLQAIIFGYIHKFLGKIIWVFPPDWFRAMVYTFMHVNVPKIEINVVDVLAVSISMLIGAVVIGFVKKAFHIRWPA